MVQRKVYRGSRGGRYYKKNGNKIYLSPGQKSPSLRRRRSRSANYVPSSFLDKVNGCSSDEVILGKRGGRYFIDQNKVQINCNQFNKHWDTCLNKQMNNELLTDNYGSYYLSRTNKRRSCSPDALNNIFNL